MIFPPFYPPNISSQVFKVIMVAGYNLKRARCLFRKPLFVVYNFQFPSCHRAEPNQPSDTVRIKTENMASLLSIEIVVDLHIIMSR
ncbi:hypothetical protein J1N35_010642 [Gossypium stocksii]|uniref:Uncharacterized protein n=1 Tax=Gossypium stocksii TaxID=47602 RepID=A0A9D4AC88_9ROSI|nr:hypothetical protein J1N35_010642 [Gossypium stocksii]